MRFLLAELEERQKSNPRFSLRAFAHKLKMDASTLHHILKGKRRAGALRRQKMLENLGFSGAELEEWLARFSDE